VNLRSKAWARASGLDTRWWRLWRLPTVSDSDTVRSQLAQVGNSVVEGKPKTRSGEDRRLDIGSRTIGALLAHQIAQDADRMAWGSAY
jgi:hypothetical protein